MPKVSIIIPNYNHASFLPKRIESVMHQTYQDFEVIILDDCSTDNSLSIIKTYAALDSRISFLINKHNSGSTFKQWNNGIAQSKGDYIWFAESDDWAEPDFLQTLVPVLDNNPEVGIVYCDSYITNEFDEIVGSPERQDINHSPGGPLQESVIVEGKNFFFNFFVRYNEIANVSSALIRKKFYVAVGGADERLRNAGDWMLYFKMLLISDLAYVNKPLNYWRRHMAATTNNTENVRTESLKVIKECISYQRSVNLQVSKASLESNFIWSFQKAYWLKPAIFSYKNLQIYFANSGIDEIIYLLRYHSPQLLKFIFSSFKNRLHLLKKNNS